MACTFSYLIKTLRVLILDFDDYLQDNNRLGEAAYLINDQILALFTAYSMYTLCLIKALRVLLLDIGDTLLDQSQLNEWAYLINDLIPALLTGNGLYFLMFNQSTETTNPGP